MFLQRHSLVSSTASSVGSDSDKWRWPENLPEALGEILALKQRALEKTAQAEARKKAAAAALEREQLRRNLAAEERDKLRNMKSENQQAAYDEEEKRLFSEAYLARTSAREQRMGTNDLARMLDRWRGLSSLRLQRYPDTIRAAVCQSNLACILHEFYSDNIHAGLESLDLIRAAASTVMNYLDTLGFGFGPLVIRDKEIDFSFTPEEETTDKDANAEIDPSESTKPEPVTPLGTAPFLLVILLNYIANLRHLDNTFELGKVHNVKLAVEALEDRLTTRERDKLHLERTFEGVLVLTFGDIRYVLENVMEEMRLERQLAEEEAQRVLAEAQRALEKEQAEEAERRRLEEERLARLKAAEDEKKRRPVCLSTFCLNSLELDSMTTSLLISTRITYQPDLTMSEYVCVVLRLDQRNKKTPNEP